ncbi:hypothetical protein VTN96DRAFT_1622 [Rasamsonia emersonii]
MTITTLTTGCKNWVLTGFGIGLCDDFALLFCFCVSCVSFRPYHWLISAVFQVGGLVLDGNGPDGCLVTLFPPPPPLSVPTGIRDSCPWVRGRGNYRDFHLGEPPPSPVGSRSIDRIIPLILLRRPHRGVVKIRDRPLHPPSSAPPYVLGPADSPLLQRSWRSQQ